MGFHTFDPDQIDRLEDPTRFRFCSREELLQWLPTGRAANVLDVGSGSGFYTDEIAPFVGHMVALDVQPEMHGHYRERGVPDNVAPVTADAEALPFADGTFDGAFSTMTFHESATGDSMAELARVLSPGGRAVVFDWSAEGNGEAGPPRSERYDLDRAQVFLSEAGFEVEVAAERSETFAVVAGV
jgi:ubiquinone/menaquinone biosynthesis C-methylase UbiE